MKAWIRLFLSRLTGRFRRGRLEATMAEEMRAHLEVLVEANLAAGMSQDEARAAAQRRLGWVDGIKETIRDQHGWVWLEQILKDAGFALRFLLRAPGFTLTVLGTLILGITVATAVSVMTADLTWRGQPFPQSRQLYLIGFKDKHSAFAPYRSRMFYEAYRQQASVFSAFAAVTRSTANVVVGDKPVAASVTGASSDCFHTLGIRPVLGRGFLPQDYHDRAKVAILSGLFWREHFNADPDILGKTVLIDREAYTVIGVLGLGQKWPVYFGGDLYRPLLPPLSVPANPLVPAYYIIGRLKAGISLQQATAMLGAVKLPAMPVWARAYLRDQRPVLTPVRDLIALSTTAWVIFVSGALLYLIACLNAMNLLLVRLLGRRRELSIRLALGGTRRRITRLLAFEGAALALAAGAVVALVVRWIFPPVLFMFTDDKAVRFTSFWTRSTLECISVLSLLGCLLMMLVPMVRLSRGEIQPGLAEGGAALGEGRRLVRLRGVLVVFQAAFAVMLLAGAGLMVHTFQKLNAVDLGFNPTGKVKVQISFPAGDKPKPETRLQLFGQLKQRLAALPGVEAVAVGQDSLLVGAYFGTLHVTLPDGTSVAVAMHSVGPDFLRVAGLRLVRGRWLSDRRGDVEAVINESMARALFGAEDPIGRSFKFETLKNHQFKVVGVTRDVRYAVKSSPGLAVYLPTWMSAPSVSTIFVKTHGDPKPGFADLVRRAIYKVDPRLVVSSVKSIDELISSMLWSEHRAYRMLKSLAGIALGLALVGLFSVIAYTVNSRMREFGLRMALGATPGNLHRLVLKRSLATAGLGVALGVGGALGLSRFMESLLYETTPSDPWVYLVVAALLLVAATAACWLPARKASRADTAQLLRTE